jgi:hypothetical protein
MRQPNGLLARYSSVVDDLTHVNATEEEMESFYARSPWHKPGAYLRALEPADTDVLPPGYLSSGDDSRPFRRWRWALGIIAVVHGGARRVEREERDRNYSRSLAMMGQKLNEEAVDAGKGVEDTTRQQAAHADTKGVVDGNSGGTSAGSAARSGPDVDGVATHESVVAYLVSRGRSPGAAEGLAVAAASDIDAAFRASKKAEEVGAALLRREAEDQTRLARDGRLESKTAPTSARNPG